MNLTEVKKCSFSAKGKLRQILTQSAMHRCKFLHRIKCHCSHSAGFWPQRFGNVNIRSHRAKIRI